jgi:hypothetical protein
MEMYSNQKAVTVGNHIIILGSSNLSKTSGNDQLILNSNCFQHSRQMEKSTVKVCWQFQEAVSVRWQYEEAGRVPGKHV